MNAQNVVETFLHSAIANESGKTQVSMRLQTFLVDLSKRWAEADGRPYQEILRAWATKGLLDTLRESLVIHWYFHLLENGKVHAGFEAPRINRYYREEAAGKLVPLSASLDIWFESEGLGYLHSIASRLVDVAVSAQNALVKNRRRVQGSFFHVTRVPILALVEVHGNLGGDPTGFDAMDRVLTEFESGATTWVQKVIEEGVRLPTAEEDERRMDETAAAAKALRALNETQVKQGVNTLRSSLEVFLERGIIDEAGQRKRRASPLESLAGGSDVV